ncbi:ABC transporter permease [Vineibacter terrae]|uniref:ABC transporter permease n=1 Tax=Vineibacter terrae TaxID=2586908 RepID=UPI002E2FA765|nr:ABC transporter permease [Vineibacter terrae]HEX2891241.1 ABC transporter permease [Vineibacter terrae]
MDIVVRPDANRLAADGRWWRVAGRFYLVIGYLFLVLPIATMIVFSFQKGQFAAIPGQGWSLRWYDKLLEDGTLLEALRNSLIVSPLAATGACVLGFFAAYAVNRFKFRGRGAFSVLLVLPVLIPPLILGVAFLGLLSRIGLQGQLSSVLLTHVVVVTAPAMAVIQLRLGQMPRSLEEAAWDLGATELQTLYKVVLPFALPGIAGGWLLAFTFSFDEFIIAWFVSGFEQTLPVAVYAYIVGSVDPSLNAVGSIVFGLSVLCLIGVELLLFPLLLSRYRSASD